MKPNINFLRKVAAGNVAAVFGYSVKRGGHYYFRGGEVTAEKHKAAGFVKPWGGASLGRSARVELTDAGIAALKAADESAAQ